MKSKLLTNIMLMTCWLVLSSSAWSQNASPEETAKGLVFWDQNENSRHDDGEPLLAGVRVSNGRQIVKTDDAGRYSLPVDDDDIVFVIKPRGFRTPLSKEHLPRFYYIHKPNGSPALTFRGVTPTGPLPDAIDFPLYKQDEPEQFRAVLFGDPQPRDQKEVDYIAHDVVEELIGVDASFGVTLGDIAFDNLSTFEPLNRTIALIGIPWYNVIGNHDVNSDAPHDQYSDETFERIYGPAYYSFDHGPVHFIVLDDIEWFVPETEGRGRYRGGLGADQIAFVRNDLALLPEDQLVVLMMHIPLTDVHDRGELYRLIEKRPFCISISGHTHYHEHRFITREDGWQGPEPHHHIVNVTVSGSWWSGAPDERGIPHTMMKDGAPNGYSIISFDGTRYKLDFKAAGRPAEYQIQIHAPQVVSLDKLRQTFLFANVFNGSSRSRVEFRVGEDADWVEMKQVREVDPTYQAIFDLETAVLDKSPQWRKLPAPRESGHLWKVPLPGEIAPGTHLIQVRSTFESGRRHHAQRVLRVVDEQPLTQ